MMKTLADLVRQLAPPGSSQQAEYLAQKLAEEEWRLRIARKKIAELEKKIVELEGEK